MTLIRDVITISSLAVADYRHESQLSFCLIVALAAVLAPLLVLFGLRHGIVSTLRDELHRNPTTLELRPLTQGRYNQSFFAQVRDRDETDFLLPNTRFLAATVALQNVSYPTSSVVDAEMIPTATGDPLLKGTIIDILLLNEAVLSQTAAEKLKAKPGDDISGRLGRVIEDRHEKVQFPLQVRAIIPVAMYSRDAVFVAPEFLLMAEDYREGFAVPIWKASGRERSKDERLFASFRLYARSIDDVSSLRDWLAASSVDTDTRLAEIHLVQRLDRALTTLFLVIAGLGGIGFGLSLTISLWGNVERKRYELSVLRLLGLSSVALAAFPVVQANLTGIFGALLAGLFYMVASPVINSLFAEGLATTQVICRLPASSFLLALALTLVLSITAAIGAGWRATHFSPAEGLRYE